MNDLRTSLDRLILKHEVAARSISDERQRLWQAKGRLRHVTAALELTQEVAEAVQNTVHARIAAVVSKCLHTIFGDLYSFRINFVKKRGKTEAELVLVTQAGEELDPGDSIGGGIVDVVSFALRLACLVLTQPKRRRLLCLDESFRHLSRGYRTRIAGLLETLAEELDLQVISVTHSEQLIVGQVEEL